MKPYYADTRYGITIYHGDCRDIYEWLSADVLLTDPPYGIAFKSGQWPANFEIAGDADVAVRDAVLAMWPDHKPAAVFGSWKAPRPREVRQRLIWDKSAGTGPGMGDLSQAFGPADEEIYLLGDWPCRGKRRPNILRTAVGIRSLAMAVGHPTPKPVQLLRQLLEVAVPGVVADPFMGSGSTLVAARDLGRPAIGIELEERYCEIAANRLAQDVLCFEESAP